MKPSISYLPSKRASMPRSTSIPPIRSFCRWHSRRAAANSPLRKSRSTFATNVHTIQAFLDRSITVEELTGENEPARVVIA